MTLAVTSYLDKDEADTYFACILDTEYWEDASDSEKDRALTQATILVDSLNYIDYPLTEIHAFPRTGQSAVPDNVKKAVCEIALSLLGDNDAERDYDDIKIVSEGYSSVRAAYAKDIPIIHKMLGIPSRRAYTYLLPWLDLASDQVNLNRIT